jgi:hypothetical protein
MSDEGIAAVAAPALPAPPAAAIFPNYIYVK